MLSLILIPHHPPRYSPSRNYLSKTLAHGNYKAISTQTMSSRLYGSSSKRNVCTAASAGQFDVSSPCPRPRIYLMLVKYFTCRYGRAEFVNFHWQHPGSSRGDGEFTVRSGLHNKKYGVLQSNRKLEQQWKHAGNELRHLYYVIDVVEWFLECQVGLKRCC